MPPPGGAAASANISRPGELMSKLQQLAQLDPEKLKSVLGDIAKNMKSAASQSGDQKLAALADKFAQAAQTGDLSGLAPQKGAGGHHGHHGHHHGGGAAGGAAGGSSGLSQVLQGALDQVNQALAASGSASSSASTTSVASTG